MFSYERFWDMIMELVKNKFTSYQTPLVQLEHHYELS